MQVPSGLTWNWGWKKKISQHKVAVLRLRHGRAAEDRPAAARGPRGAGVWEGALEGAGGGDTDPGHRVEADSTVVRAGVRFQGKGGRDAC